jgi:hypothetical protein
MANYITLTLQTSNPILTIDAPEYAVTTQPLDVTVTSSDTITDFEIDFVDSEGTRESLIFANSGTQLIGEISISTKPSGLSTLFVRVKTASGNESIATKRIWIYNKVIIEIYDMSEDIISIDVESTQTE